MRYHLRFVKCGASLEEFKSEVSLEKKSKCPLEPVNPGVKLDGLV